MDGKGIWEDAWEGVRLDFGSQRGVSFGARREDIQGTRWRQKSNVDGFAHSTKSVQRDIH